MKHGYNHNESEIAAFFATNEADCVLLSHLSSHPIPTHCVTAVFMLPNISKSFAVIFTLA